MPKRLLIFLAVAALAIASCKGGGSTSTPPTGPPISPSPNPSIKKATVLVTIQGTPAPGIPVQESTPKSTSSPRPGTPFDTEVTGIKGLVHFLHLKPSKTYCWVAIIGPHQTSSECASWAIWQTQTISLGT
jgi:hypothetical protein